MFALKTSESYQLRAILQMDENKSHIRNGFALFWSNSFHTIETNMSAIVKHSLAEDMESQRWKGMLRRDGQREGYSPICRAIHPWSKFDILPQQKLSLYPYLYPPWCPRSLPIPDVKAETESHRKPMSETIGPKSDDKNS